MGRSYTQKTIKLLFGTATHCAYPECDRPLILKERGLYTPTAQIAHIRSEQKEGPRYDQSYPLDKINDFENLLLLCGDHHPPVDRHVSQYSTEELLSWKARQSQQGDRRVAGAELAAIERILNREQPITSDAVLRGPIRSLDQGERLRQAEERLSETPLESAALFGQVADRLEGSPFIHHAAIVRGRQCAALESGASLAEAARIRVDLGWRYYFAGDAFSVGQSIRAVEGYSESLPPDIQRAVSGLSHAAAFGYSRRVTLDDLAASFDCMEPSDQGVVNVAIALSEESIAWRRIDLIDSRRGAISALAQGLPRDESGLVVEARLRMCLAESDGDWSGLIGEARSTYPPSVTAWIAARHARYLCLTGDPDEAIRRWQDAIDGAVASRLNDSAADWLYALRAVRVQYDRIGEDLNDIHRIAQSLRSTGTGSVLPEPYPLAERALSRMLDSKWPDALQFLHLNLRHAAVSASWSAELAAHERFGDLFDATGKWDEVPLHYVRSGKMKKLKELAKKWPNRSLDFGPPCNLTPPWERKAACEFASHAGKHFSRDAARAWSKYTLERIVDSVQTGANLSAWLPAFASNADEASIEDARQFLDLMASSLKREPGTHRRTDDSLINAVVKMHESHPVLLSPVVEMLCDAMLLENEVSQNALHMGQGILAQDPDRVLRRLGAVAASGGFYAALSLALAGCDTDPCLDIARKKYEEYVRPLEIQPGVLTLRMGEESNVAILVRILGEEERVAFSKAMLSRMLETQDLETNRASAVMAVAVIGPTLPDQAKESMFNTLLEFARDPAPSVVSMVHGDDPFSRFKVLEGDTSLAALSVEAAGELAGTSDQYEALQQLATTLLSSTGNANSRSIARMLRGIPEGELRLDVQMLANHSNPWVRCFAAMAWARNPKKWPNLGDRLSVDVDPGVRLMLARCLSDEPECEPVRTVLRGDYRRDISRLFD
ncbi:hypothetical protein ACFT8P_06925 [Streptomyces sp. NPDC057101]|uniref:hypothetical protein n=1 Tax=Streptomyces sp. NPDC057101 TaxID=3346020 RepID=UPI003628A0F6